MWLTMWLTTWLTMWLTIWRTRPAAAAGQQPATMMSATAAIAAHCMAHSWLLSGCHPAASWHPCVFPGHLADIWPPWLPGLPDCSLTTPSISWLLLPGFPDCSLASLATS